MKFQMSDIYVEGKLESRDERVTIYLTPNAPLTYDSNKWIYHQMPDRLTFKADMLRQQSIHRSHRMYHLKFEFPENIKPDATMLQFLRSQGFQIGSVELYAIEAADLRKLKGPRVQIKRVTLENIADYMAVNTPLSLQYGEDYLKESHRLLHERCQKPTYPLQSYVAYEHATPVGIMNLIETDRTVELDGFAVAEHARGRGIGSSMQVFTGEVADTRPVILLADAEDTARDMYMKQGYTFMSFQYSVLKEKSSVLT
ncbi:GNAT family N-acetyltransferase [Staphylococcus lutrae]|uniref:GNAT family N-acetyltransferase n=1 Tax=Staphylococcus lutrae TaxID=155085 RepID=A0AAC9RVC2_9STAP|nr:GNAT family N-acetyltransferase [Staphylococcus lutrae]ARJ50437.1 GNAT family N-acetyltransferase [Staphylococcus lutrae]PNZ38783.1 N-acetyltransferase [Staphylococcus lutrae]